MVSCSPRSTGERLHRADSLLMDEPEAAAATLDSINPSDLRSKADQIFFDLLSTEISYKLNDLPKSDSLIQTVVDFYDRQDDSSLRGRAYFQLANILASQQRYGEALVAYLNAEHSANLAQNHLLHALVYRGIADTFSDLSDHASALYYRELALESFKQSGIDRYINWAIWDYACANFNALNYNKAISLADKSHELASEAKDTALIAHSMKLKIHAQVFTRDFYSAISTFKELYALDSTKLGKDDWINLGIAYMETGNPKEAKRINNIHIPSESPNHLQVLIAVHDNNYKEAFSRISKNFDEQNKRVADLYLRDYENIITQYYSTIQQQKQEEILFQKKVITSLSVGIILIIIFSFLYYRHRAKLHKEAIKKKICQAQQLLESLHDKDKLLKEERMANSHMENALCTIKSEIEEKSTTIEILSKKIETQRLERVHLSSIVEETKSEKELLENRNKRTERELQTVSELLFNQKLSELKAKQLMNTLLQNQFVTIKKICQSFYQYQTSPKKQEKLYSQLVSLVNEINSDEKILSQLEPIIDLSMNNIMSHFREDFPNLKRDQYNLMIFTILGFPLTGISFLQNVEIHTIYSRKANLKRKINASESKYKDEFLLILK